jgi:hypothetical protein
MTEKSNRGLERQKVDGCCRAERGGCRRAARGVQNHRGVGDGQNATSDLIQYVCGDSIRPVEA